MFKLTPVFGDRSQTEFRQTVLYSFRAGTDAALAQGGVIADASGALYGMTVFGGSGACSSGTLVGNRGGSVVAATLVDVCARRTGGWRNRSHRTARHGDDIRGTTRHGGRRWFRVRNCPRRAAGGLFQTIRPWHQGEPRQRPRAAHGPTELEPAANPKHSRGRYYRRNGPLGDEPRVTETNRMKYSGHIGTHPRGSNFRWTVDDETMTWESEPPGRTISKPVLGIYGSHGGPPGSGKAFDLLPGGTARLHSRGPSTAGPVNARISRRSR